MGWWRAGRFDRDAWLGATASLAIMFSSVVAYAQQGTSLVLPLLVMQGGMLLVADAIDRVRRRPMHRDARWTLGFVAAGVAIGTWPKVAAATGWAVPPPGQAGAAVALTCAAVYLLGYVGKLAALDERKGDLSFLVGDMTLTAALGVPAACAVAAVGGADFAHVGSYAADWRAWAAGLASQGAGLFGVLIYLNRRPHTVCVPVSRAGKMIAGLVAAVVVALVRTPSPWTWAALLPALPCWEEVVGALAILPALWIGFRSKATAAPRRVGA